MASRSRIELTAVGLAVLVALAVGCGGPDSSTDTTTATLARNEPAPGLPYLLYTSDRDGNDEVYGVRADGKRTVQITRDGDKYDIFGVLVAPNWRWLFRPGEPRLVSSDGRKVLGLSGLRYVELGAFSSDATRLAYGEDSNLVSRPRTMLLSTETGRSRLLGRGDLWSFSPDGTLLAMTDPTDRSVRLKLVRVPSGRVLGTRDIPWPHDYEGEGLAFEVGWSPGGKSLAYIADGTLWVADVTRDPFELHAVLVDPGLDSDAWYELPARWLDDETISILLVSEQDDRTELSVVTLDGDRTVLADEVGSGVQWSPDGEHVAYAAGPEQHDLVVSTRTGSDRDVVLRTTAYPAWVWTPDGRLLVGFEKSHERVLELVDLDGNTEEIFRTSGYLDLGRATWSPDGRFLSLGTELPLEEGAQTDDKAIGILSLAERRVTRVPLVGNVNLRGWADSSVGGGRVPDGQPELEVASGYELRSQGGIAEIAASGRRVAAIVEESKLDCHHVVAWTVGNSRVVRFAGPRLCGSDGENAHGDQDTIGIELAGTKLSWTGESWGNFAYLTGHTADMLRPEAGIRSSGGDEGLEEGVDRPKPELSTHRGVSVKVENGAVVLTRESDGRARTLTALGGIVDAELENEGLFYAYNADGPMKGHIVFVPFAKLFG